MSKLIAVLLAVLFAFFGCMRHPGLTIEALKNGQYKAESFRTLVKRSGFSRTIARGV